MRIVHAIHPNCPYDGVGLGREPHRYSLGLPKGVIIQQAGDPPDRSGVRWLMFMTASGGYWVERPCQPRMTGSSFLPRRSQAQGFTLRQKHLMLQGSDLPSDQSLCPHLLRDLFERTNRLLQALSLQWRAAKRQGSLTSWLP